jgi:hypothetical protein
MSQWLVAGLLSASVAITFGCSTAAAADPQPGVSAYALSAGRLGAIVAGLVGLAGTVIGWLALRSAGRAGTGRSAATVSLAAGLIGTALGALVVATAEGGVGTGNGLGGGIVAVVVGLTGAALGGLALARSRRG